jgi:alpha-tubulin suppressor-like RCC1 family protein
VLQVNGQWGACGWDGWCNVRPAAAPGYTQLAQLSITTDHGCALGTDGFARCWGADYEGQLGDGTAGDYGTGAVQLASIARIETAQESNSPSAQFTCAVGTGGNAYCWGGNGYGQFGIGSFDQVAHPVPTRVLAPVDFTMLSAGRGFTCGATTGGAVYCWGRNSALTLGHVSVDTCLGPACTLTPTQVPGLSGVAEIDSGEEHTCARRTDGTVYCWGSNYLGQLGTGSTTASLLPVQVPGLTNVVQLALGYTFSCALRGDGTVWCWGSNDHGQLGSGGGQQSSPVQVPGLSNVTQISAGGYMFSDYAMNACARRSDGAVYCWGANAWGQLGNGAMSWDPLGPTRVLF